MSRYALAHAMKERRLELGLTVVELVEASGVSRSTWSELEAAKRSRLTAPVGIKIDSALGWMPGQAAEVFAEEHADMEVRRAGSIVVAEVKRPIYADADELADARRQPPSFRDMLESQLTAINERLATLEEQPTWVDELHDAWRRLSASDRATFLRLMQLAASQ